MVRQADLENWCCDNAPNCGCSNEKDTMVQKCYHCQSYHDAYTKCPEKLMSSPTDTPPTQMHLCCENFPDCDCGENDDEVTEGWNPINHKSEAQAKLDEAYKKIEELEELNQRYVEQFEPMREEITRLRIAINTPETEDFLKGMPLEAAHQIERWGSDHDRNKSTFDWVFLIGHLTTRAAGYYDISEMDEKFLKKAKHHCITAAAALLNWHRYMSDEQKNFLPGINPKRYFKGD